MSKFTDDELLIESDIKIPGESSSLDKGYIELGDLDEILSTLASPFAIHIPKGNSTQVDILGGNSAAITSTMTASNVATTNFYTSLKRVESLITVAATTATALYRWQTPMWFRGASDFFGGFKFAMQFGLATGQTIATHRAFFGLAPGTGMTDVNPTTVINTIGVGWDSGDTNISIISNDGSGTGAKIGLGSDFPRPTTDRTNAYTLVLDCGRNKSFVKYKVTNHLNGAVAEGSITTKLPVATTLLIPNCYTSVGGTSSVTGFSFSYIFIK